MNLRGANSPLPHCGLTGERAGGRAVILRGANSPLPHCGELERVLKPTGSVSTRGEFAPPSLRHVGSAIRRRRVPATRGEFAPPSLRHHRRAEIAGRPIPYEGRIRPSLIAASFTFPRRRYSSTYEGRIRPSLIAAGIMPGNMRLICCLRGANSPLPHCGRLRDNGITTSKFSTRGEFAPPSLRRVRPGRENGRLRDYEGRIRPSLIAAQRPRPTITWPTALRGANSPLPHCGGAPAPAPVVLFHLRGANSPLPHCGVLMSATNASFVDLRGANSPLPHCGLSRGEVSRHL